MSTLKKALFIDRDGTLLVEPADEQIDSLEKFAFVPGAISALKSLTGLDYELVMVSNQDGLGTPAFPTETFLPCQNLLLNTLEGEGIHFDNILIDKTFPYENAPTRKPGTGLLGAYLDGSYDLGESYVIGDRDSDLQLAENLGAQALQVAFFKLSRCFWVGAMVNTSCIVCGFKLYENSIARCERFFLPTFLRDFCAIFARFLQIGRKKSRPFGR